MQYLKSRTVWTVVLMFVVGGITGVKELIPTEYMLYVNGLLAMAAIYFRAHPRVK